MSGVRVIITRSIRLSDGVVRLEIDEKETEKRRKENKHAEPVYVPVEREVSVKDARMLIGANAAHLAEGEQLGGGPLTAEGSGNALVDGGGE